MLTIYEPPYDLRVPSQNNDEARARYVGALRNRALFKPHLREPLDPIIGEVIRFQHAAGVAAYIVWSHKPLALVHIKLPGIVRLPRNQEQAITLTEARRQQRSRLASERKAARDTAGAWKRPPVQLSFGETQPLSSGL